MKNNSASAQLLMASPAGIKLLQFHQTTVCPWALELVAISSMSFLAPFKLKKLDNTAGFVTFHLLV